MYTVSQKKQDTKLLFVSSPNIDRFLKFFYCYTRQEICNKKILQISPHLKGVATLPCEILVNKNCTDRKHSNSRPGVHIADL